MIEYSHCSICGGSFAGLGNVCPGCEHALSREPLEIRQVERPTRRTETATQPQARASKDLTDALDIQVKRYSRPRWTVGYYLHGTQWRENRGKREDGAEPQAVTIRMEKTAKKEAKK